ncbi:MAG TPA: MarP family serine protease [Solirubrobacterales bacterium]|nr:MarP family serine protease [Solirubrobacterales bacterium]
MTPLDWGIAVFTFILALWGFRQGLIVGILGLAGLAVGAVLGSRLAPVVLDHGSNSPYAPMAALVGAIVVGSVTLAMAVTLGERVRDSTVRHPFWEVVDGIGGALLIAAVGLGIVWVLGAVAVYSPGSDSLRRDVQKSLLLSGINDVMPPSGPLIQALHRISPVPQVATSPGDIARPDQGAGSEAAVRKAADSVVKVAGTSCGVGVMGSGWAVGPDTFVTNAHVVAGQDDTHIETNSGNTVPATPIAFNPKNDIALLRADLDLPALPALARARRGTSAAVIGYPNDGPLTITPARAGDTRLLVGQDAYGTGRFERLMLGLRGDVRHGNSGGPLVDVQGRVLGTVFAATTEGPSGGLAIPNRVLARISEAATGAEVDTGPCA